MDLPKRKPTRLTDFDYGAYGYYFEADAVGMSHGNKADAGSVGGRKRKRSRRKIYGASG